MKTTKHEFSIELYNKAKENPDRYEFVYRDGAKPLGVNYMEGLVSAYPITSWVGDLSINHLVNGSFKTMEEKHALDLFILEKHALTYREALESLPDGYRELGLEEAEKQGWYEVKPNNECKSISKALYSCFNWADTSQGWNFWMQVKDHYEKGTPLPPLPVKEEKAIKGGVQQQIVVDKEGIRVEPITEEFASHFNVKQVDQERLDKFVCAAMGAELSLCDAMSTKEIMSALGLDADTEWQTIYFYRLAAKNAIAYAKETLKQLEGGEG